TVTRPPDVHALLEVRDAFPEQAEWVRCLPSCTQLSEHQVAWELEGEGDEGTILQLTLRAKPTLMAAEEENRVVVVDSSQEPVAIGVVTATAVPSPTLAVPGDTRQTSRSGDPFWVVEGEAVPRDEGLVMEVLAPWDPRTAILVVTGATDRAVGKAAQAMSVETAFPGMSGQVALVRDLHRRSAPSPSSSSKKTFAEMGYSDRTFIGGFVQEASYYFDVPVGWYLQSSASLELHIRHSKLVDFDRSALSVSLNSTPIASIPLRPETADDARIQIKLPATAVRWGRNKLVVTVEMPPRERCTSLFSRRLWLTLFQDSFLSLEHKQATSDIFSLDYFPAPFNYSPDLEDVLLVLPSDSGPALWEAALRVAAMLGSAVREEGGAMRPGIVWDHELPPPEQRSAYHLIAFGRPTANRLIQEINPQLPQPFLPGTDRIVQRLDNVIFSLPEGLSLGYVQLLPSPWNTERAVLVVTGTTDEGVLWAARSLVRGDLVWRLKGNLA
ncbi:MAG: hypothetical protein D6759_09950, partial [Chloroflexi bacterium]